MADPFESPRAMLDRAQFHIDSLAQQAAAYLDSDPHAQVTEFNPEVGFFDIKVVFHKPIPIISDVIAGDAISNIRSALDQIGYIVTAASRGVAGKLKAAFPFGDTITEVLSRKSGDSKQIPSSIFDIMASFEPYLGGNTALWAVNKLSNANKHRLLSATGVMATRGPFSFASGKGNGSIFFGPFESAKNEMILARASNPDDVQNSNFNITAYVAFASLPEVGVHSATGILKYALGSAREVLAAVEVEAARMHLF
jgi:hypothetical protein